MEAKEDMKKLVEREGMVVVVSGESALFLINVDCWC